MPIEVAPHEATDLTQPQTGGEFRVEEVPPNRVPVRCGQKDLQLLLGQNVHRLVGNFGGLHMFGGVVGHQPLVCCRLEGLVEGGVDTADGGGREAGVLAGARGNSPLLQKEAVQFPQVFSGELREPLLPQAGLDMAVHVAPVPFQGVGP